jgi:hypothetical protein
MLRRLFAGSKMDGRDARHAWISARPRRRVPGGAVGAVNLCGRQALTERPQSAA